MYQNLKKRTEGFTIIEVLIVLAIAGLILLIVFLAVPALQRNSRNTQRRNDVASILGQVTEYSNANNGTLPTQTLLFGRNAVLDDGNAATQNQIVVSTGYYDSASAGSGFTNGTGAQTNNTGVESMMLVRGAACNGGNAVAGPGRSFVILYTLETNVKQCQAS